MWPHVVVFPPKAIQPSLLLGGRFTLADGALQRSVHAFDLPLCLRVANSAEANPNPLAQDPDG